MVLAFMGNFKIPFFFSSFTLLSDYDVVFDCLGCLMQIKPIHCVSNSVSQVNICSGIRRHHHNYQNEKRNVVVL